MISTYQRLQRRREAGEIDGFTLIELLIVIVVLGILAAVVIFALGGITGKSAVASCQADGATVSTAISAFNAQNANVTPTPALLTGTTDGGPYLQSFPSNIPHYAYAVADGSSTYVAPPNSTIDAPGHATLNYYAAGTLLVSTGDTVTFVAATGTAPNIVPAHLTFTSGNTNGNLTSTVGTSTTPGGSAAPWYPYVGPSSCTDVS
jgi:prepilin-type N-terminal cleavage/methylation domain-containing protein